MGVCVSFLCYLYFRFYSRLFISCLFSIRASSSSAWHSYNPRTMQIYTTWGSFAQLIKKKNHLVTLTSLFLPSFMKRKQGKLLGQVNFLYPYVPVQYKTCNYERHAVLARFPVSWGCILVLHCVCCAGGQNWNQPVNFLRDPLFSFSPLLLFS